MSGVDFSRHTYNLTSDFDDGLWAAKTAKIQLVQTNQTCNKISQRFHAVSQLIHAFN